MDGTKLVTETIDLCARARSVVGGCSVWVELCSREHRDRIELRILVVVGAIYSENL